MPVKAIILPKEELKVAVENIIKEEGKNITSVEIMFNENTEQDVAVVNADGMEFEREIESLIPQLNKIYSVDIHKYEGFDYAEFAGQSGGYVFLFN